MLKLFPFVLVFILSSCSTKNFVGNPSESYGNLTCPLEETQCDISFGESSDFISYEVKQVGARRYSVQGNIQLFMQIPGAMQPKVSFYILFMNDESVLLEKRVKTRRKGGFDFTVETPEPITKTAVHEVLYHYRT